MTIFQEIAIILLMAAMGGLLAQLLRQPLLIAFILIGILAGPAFLGLTHVSEYMALLAELGISLLLFVVGLKLDLQLIRSTGMVALTTGLGQVLFTSIIGFLIGLGFGLDPITSLYVAIALTFSSTIIIVKLLSDKGEVDALHGRVALGFLIVQDLVVVLLMIGLSAFGLVGQEANLSVALLEVMAKGAVFLTAVALFMRFLAEPVVHRLAFSSELLMLFVVAWAVSVAAITDYLGFSKELGALVAGVSLASTSYRDIIGARMGTLRDFLLLFFFIHLGSTLDLSTIGHNIPFALILSLFVLIGNPLIVMIIMGMMGYRSRTSFLAGLTVAQISEFSLIFAALGLSLGHINEETVGLITLVGLITIGLSTYMILYSQQLYSRLAPVLSIFERGSPHQEAFGMQAKPDTIPTPHEVAVFGLGRYGRLLPET